MTDYEITVDGLRGSALLPYAETLSQLAADNAQPSDELKIQTLIRAPEKIRELISESFVKTYANPGGDGEPGVAPFTVAGARIILRGSDWGQQRPEIKDVQALSLLHPDIIFYFTTVNPNNTRVAIDGLENFWRCRVENGQITATYRAQPVIWEERTF